VQCVVAPHAICKHRRVICRHILLQVPRLLLLALPVILVIVLLVLHLIHGIPSLGVLPNIGPASTLQQSLCVPRCA